MPPTVEEILKQTGLTDEQIKGLDAKIVTGFSTVLSTATQAQTDAAAAREAAEIASRAQTELYEKQIAPALDGWATEKANLEAQAAYYRTQNESARSAGFIPKDAPGYTAPSGAQNMPVNQDPNTGRFVPGANPVPGSPAYMTADKVYAAVTNASWLANQHIRLYGQPLPDEIETVLKEASDRRLEFRTYADQKYKFTERSNQIAAEKQQQIIDAKVKEGMAAREKELSERFGNNPNLRQPITSNFSDVARAQASGQRKDPLMLTEQQRREQTRDYITTSIAQQNAS